MTLEAYIVPPLIGAVIGYLTNSVAIRMLFRPLKRVTLLGIPVPFTPGVIPRQREELADRIATMVARELLTEDVFLRRIESDTLKQALRRRITSGIDVILEISPDDLRSVAGRPELTGVIAAVRRLLPDIAESLRPLQFLSPEQGGRVVDQLWPEVVHALQSLITTPEVQRELEVRVRRVVRFSLDQMSSFQRFLVTATQYDRQIDQSVPAIADRVVREAMDALHGPDLQKTVRSAAEAWITDHQDLSLAPLLHSFPEGPDITVLHRMIVPLIRRRRWVITRQLTDWIQTGLARFSAVAVRKLDIHRVVLDRINSLDVERVEGLILGIIHRHLKWINLFGALVGALIGSIQVVLRIFGVL